MKHKSSKSLSNTNLNYVRPSMRKQTTTAALDDPSTPQNAFRRESIKQLLQSMKSLQVSMRTHHSSMDTMTQMQISNHASSTAKRLSKIIQRSNVYNNHHNHDDDPQNYLLDPSQCLSPSKTPKAIPSFVKQKFKDFLSLSNNEPKHSSSDTTSHCEHLKTEVKLQNQSTNRSKLPSKTLFDNKFNSPLNERLTLNPNIKQRIEEFKRKKKHPQPLSITNGEKKPTQHNKKSIKKKNRKSIVTKLLLISTIQNDADKYSRQLSKELLHEHPLPSISSSRAKVDKKTQVLIKVSSAYLETTNKIGKENAKQKMKKAQNDYNIQSSHIIHKAIDSLLNEDNQSTNKPFNSPSEENINAKTKDYSQMDYNKEGFENIDLDQKFNYNNGLWKKTERQRFINKMKKIRCAWDDQSFLKAETTKNHILKSMYPLTPRLVKFSKINSMALK